MCPEANNSIEGRPKEWAQDQVTILVHGTFANLDHASGHNGAPVETARDEQEKKPEKWWRLTPRGGVTHADRLKEALKEIDEENNRNGVESDWAATVWHPEGNPDDKGLSYWALCEWSSENTHGERIKAAEKLADRLHELAVRRKCTAEKPLMVNFVAHSHGGNVVLEVLRRLGAQVRARQVCMLGTPLTLRYDDPRFLYFPALIVFFLAWLLRGPGAFGGLVPFLPFSQLWFVGLVYVPLMLWVGASMIYVMRAVTEWWSPSPAYGSDPADLRRELRGRPALLFISREDEADLALQLGAAPIDAYRAMVMGRPRLKEVTTPFGMVAALLWRPIELVYLRPLSFGVVAPLFEGTLEWKALGFPLSVVGTTNFETVTWTAPEFYHDAIDTEHVDLEPRSLKVPIADSKNKIPAATGTVERGGTDPDPKRLLRLRATVKGTIRDLVGQVHLRHSAYYGSQDVIDKVARAIAAPAPSRIRSKGRRRGDRRSPGDRFSSRAGSNVLVGDQG